MGSLGFGLVVIRGLFGCGGRSRRRSCRRGGGVGLCRG